MDTVEHEKLRWIGNLPETPFSKQVDNPDSISGLHSQLASSDLSTFEVRFDLSGNVLPPDTSLPPFLGLHHHGDDSSLPGYTLQELAHLSRSVVPAQRALSLRVLSAILKRAWRGDYHIFQTEAENESWRSTGKGERRLPPAPCGRKLEANVVTDSDGVIVTLLGLYIHTTILAALHDAQVTTIVTAAEALANLLCIEEDEELADDMALFPYGLSLPLLYDAGGVVHKADEDNDDIGKRSVDNEQHKYGDIVEDLLSRGLLPRLQTILANLAYIDAHANVLRVLIRIARHSAECALEVAETKGLFAIIDGAITRGCTARIGKHAGWLSAKLIRVLCLADQRIAMRLYDSDLLSRLYSYFIVCNVDTIAIGPMGNVEGTRKVDGSDAGGIASAGMETDAKLISIEAYRAWNACLMYGIGSQDWAHLHTLFFDRMQRVKDETLVEICKVNFRDGLDSTIAKGKSSNALNSSVNHEARELASLVSVLTTLTSIATTPSSQSATHSLHFKDISGLYAPLSRWYGVLMKETENRTWTWTPSPSVFSEPILSIEGQALISSLAHYLAKFLECAQAMDPRMLSTVLGSSDASLLAANTAQSLSHMCNKALKVTLMQAAPARAGLPYRFMLLGSWVQGNVSNINRDCSIDAIRSQAVASMALSAAELCRAFTGLVSLPQQESVFTPHKLFSGLNLPSILEALTKLPLLRYHAPRVAGDAFLVWARWHTRCITTILMLISHLEPSLVHTEAFQTLLYCVWFLIEPGWENLASALIPLLHIQRLVQPSDGEDSVLALQHHIVEELNSLVGGELQLQDRSGCNLGKGFKAVALPSLLLPHRQVYVAYQ